MTFPDDISRLLIPIEKKNLLLQQKLVSTKIHVIAGLKLTTTIIFCVFGGFYAEMKDIEVTK